MATKTNKKKVKPMVQKESGVTTLSLPRMKDEGYTSKKMYNFTGAYRTIYNRLDETVDKDFQKWIKERFSLTDIEYRTVCSVAKSARNGFDEIIEELKERTKELTDIINDCNQKPEHRFASFRERAKLLKVINADNITFGGRDNIRRLTRQHNLINNVEEELVLLNKEYDALLMEKSFLENSISYIKKRQRKLNKCNERIKKNRNRTQFLENKLKNPYDVISHIMNDMTDRRNMQFGFIGEANYKGNRFIKDIDFKNLIITVKVTREIEHNIVLHNVKPKKLNELRNIWAAAQMKKIPLTCYIDEENISIQYDKMLLNGTSIDSKSMIAEYKILKQDETKTDDEKKEIRKEIYRKYSDEQERRIVSLPLPNGKAKIPHRGISYDINPGEIGWCVWQLNDDGSLTIIAAGRISYDEDIKHLNVPLWSAKQKHQRNCLHNDIYLAVKKLFETAEHYQCSESIREDLDFKIKFWRFDRPTESNYKINNVWCRTYIETTIHRRCVEIGILDVVINPAHSSFIGGIQNRGFCDSTAAAIEIARRGATRHINGSFYPLITEKDIATLRDVFLNTPDVELCVDKDVLTDILSDINTSSSWIDVYKSIKECFKRKADFEHRYRTNYQKAA